MTLEDFFTLTEIKDGLTATSRVEELVSVMQRNKDSIVKNAGDASRQWAAVASMIAATKNKECLDVFMQLGGLLYLNGWLNDAQRLSNDSSDISVEESILALLQALENLGVDSPGSISSGVWHVVKNLLNHGSSRVQDLARTLFDSWKLDKAYDHSECDDESISQLHKEDETKFVASGGESSGQKFHAADPFLLREGNNGETHADGIDEAGSSLLGNTEKNKPDADKGMEPQNDKLGSDSNTNTDCYNKRANTLDGTPSGEIIDAVQESFPAKEKCFTGDSAPTGARSPLHPEKGSAEGLSDAPVAAELSRDGKKMDELGSSENAGAAVAAASGLVGPVAMLTDSAVERNEEIKKEPHLQKTVDSNDAEKISSDPKCGLKDVSVMHNCSKEVLPLTHKNNKYDSDTSSGSFGDQCRHRKDQTFGETIDADIEVNKDDKDHANSKRRVKQRKKRNSRSTTVAQRLGAIDKTTADIELGIVDALEVATKVAQEVAREVDSGEPTCGSSEELSDESGQSDSADSEVGAQETPCSASPSKEALVSKKYSVEKSHGGKDHLMDLKDNKLENDTNGNEAERAKESQQPEVSAEKSPCDFDLNQEVYSDETELAVSSMSNPAPVVSVSRPIAAPGVPETPLQLERTLRWTGSAATSAFRPASPHKVSGGDLKGKQACLGIDLNVAGGGDDTVEDLTPQKLFPFSSNFRSADSSQEARQRESDRFNLDLNCANDGDDAPPPSDLRMETRLFLTRNGHQSTSPASSSSSAQPPLKKVNIDLNDRPQFLIDAYGHQGPNYARHPWRTTTPYGAHQSDEPVISIFGTKVEVNRRDCAPPVTTFLRNGKSTDPTLDLNVSRTGDTLGLTAGVSYQPSPIYGYNGLTSHPGMSMSFSSPVYVPGTSIPYMMDSRGAPVVMPQLIASAPHIQPAYPQQQTYPPQQPFFMNMAGGSMSLNGSLPLQPNYDRSSGIGVEVGNRDSLSLRQFLSPGQGRPMGEHLGTNAEASSGSSIVGGKRKEPETGWMPYTLNSRPQYPPWR